MHPTARAGWATGEITPPLGLPMGGRGPRFAPGLEIFDPLLAQVTVLEDAASCRTVWVSVDLIELSPPHSTQVVQGIAAALQVAPEAVLINASHTHSGPMMGFYRYATLQTIPPELGAYFASLPPRLIRLAIEAEAAMTPAEVFWREGPSHIGINRRLPVDGRMTMGPNPQGCYDTDLWLLEIRPVGDPDRRCLLFAHGCHPVMVYGFAWQAISAEWPGVSRRALQAALGPQTHAQFFQGLAGNVRPRILADEANRCFRQAAPHDVQQVGEELAGDVLALLGEAAPPLNLALAAGHTWFLVPRSSPPPRAHWEAMVDSPHEHERECARYWLSRYQPDAVPPVRATPWPIGLLQLAPGYLIVSIAGEPVAEWRTIVQAALPEQRLALWGYTHDCCGYLPTDALIPEGGYEVSGYPMYGRQTPASFEPGIDAAASAALHRLARVIDGAVCRIHEGI